MSINRVTQYRDDLHSEICKRVFTYHLNSEHAVITCTLLLYNFTVCT